MTADGIRWHGSLEDARTDAGERGTLVLIDLFDPGCGGCARMGESTYPNPDVQRYVQQHLSALRFNVVDDPDVMDLFDAAWTPGLIVQDAEGREYRRSFGYLDAPRFLGEMALARLAESIHRRDHPAARERAVEAVKLTKGDRWRQPEALYFGSIAAARAANAPARLVDGWTQLITEFPDSDWARKAEVILK